MSFAPEKLFIGLSDFFSILMPGALVAYLAKDLVPGAEAFSIDNAQHVAIFLFVAYAAGHFVFLVGAVVLDNFIYDPLRNCTASGLFDRLGRGRKPPHRLWRRLAGSKALFGKEPDAALMRVLAIKARTLRPRAASAAINAYQWCKTRLSKEHPDGLLEVNRLEAHSKFFRSFTVVLIGLAVMFIVTLDPRAPIGLVFALLALWRYVDQRFKSSQQAYWHIISLEASNPSPSRRRRSKLANALTHAGGIVYKRTKSGVEYLLIESSNRARWVFPKGHIEPGETPEITAVREVREESGYWARVEQHLNDVTMGGDGSPAMVRVFLMELIDEDPFEAEDRSKKWSTFADAVASLKWKESKALLVDAAARLEDKSATEHVAEAVDRA